MKDLHHQSMDKRRDTDSDKDRERRKLKAKDSPSERPKKKSELNSSKRGRQEKGSSSEDSDWRPRRSQRADSNNDDSESYPTTDWTPINAFSFGLSTSGHQRRSNIDDDTSVTDPSPVQGFTAINLSNPRSYSAGQQSALNTTSSEGTVETTSKQSKEPPKILGGYQCLECKKRLDTSAQL